MYVYILGALPVEHGVLTDSAEERAERLIHQQNISQPVVPFWISTANRTIRTGLIRWVGYG